MEALLKKTKGPVSQTAQTCVASLQEQYETVSAMEVQLKRLPLFKKDHRPRLDRQVLEGRAAQGHCCPDRGRAGNRSGKVCEEGVVNCIFACSDINVKRKLQLHAFDNALHFNMQGCIETHI